MMKVDIKNFFMPGQHNHFVRTGGYAVDADDDAGLDRRSAFREAIHFVLGSQFLSLEGDDAEEVYQIIIGSGMGMLSSDELSNFLFYKMVEEWCLDQNTRDEYGILLYLRFKDDIFIAFEGDEAKPFLFEMKRRSSFFKLKVDSFSRAEVNMLDLCVKVDKQFESSGRLSTSVFQKPSHQGSVLSNRSSHPLGVHLSWPLGRSKHFDGLYTSRGDVHKARQMFYDKMHDDCPEHPALSVLSDTCNPSFSTRARRSRCDNSWLVLPYHLLWHAARTPNLLESLRPIFLKVGLPHEFPFICWKLGGVHL